MEPSLDSVKGGRQENRLFRGHVPYQEEGGRPSSR